MSVSENNSVAKLHSIMQNPWILKQDKKIGNIPSSFIKTIKKRGPLPIKTLLSQGYLSLEYQIP